MINKSGTKTLMYIYKKPTDSKQYVTFTSNHPWQCLTNILLSLARKICTIVEHENVNEKRFKKLEKHWQNKDIPSY